LHNDARNPCAAGITHTQPGAAPRRALRPPHSPYNGGNRGSALARSAPASASADGYAACNYLGDLLVWYRHSCAYILCIRFDSLDACQAAVRQIMMRMQLPPGPALVCLPEPERSFPSDTGPEINRLECFQSVIWKIPLYGQPSSGHRCAVLQRLIDTCAAHPMWCTQGAER
jgi:hypothetical protein